MARKRTRKPGAAPKERKPAKIPQSPVRRKTENGLTPRENRFVNEYLEDPNGTIAYQRAFGTNSYGASAVQASKLLNNPKIVAAIEAGREALAQRANINQAKIIREYANVAFSDLGDIFDFDGDQLVLKAPKNIPAYARRAMSSIKVKRVWEGNGDEAVPVDIMEFRLWSKDKALEKLGQHLNLFPETHQHKHEGKVQLEHSQQKLTREQLDQIPFELKKKWLEALEAVRTDTTPDGKPVYGLREIPEGEIIECEPVKEQPSGNGKDENPEVS